MSILLCHRNRNYLEASNHDANKIQGFGLRYEELSCLNYT